MAGLVRKYKKQFKVTKKGSELLHEENAGKLYHLLFMTYFRKFNLGFYDRLPDLDELQGSIIYSIYHVGRLAKKNVRIEKISRSLVLPAVLGELELFSTDYLSPEKIICYRVIEPLEYAGLIECTREKKHWFQEIVSLKTASLYKKLIRFELK